MRIDAPYGITKRLASTDLAGARARMAEALAAEGFGVLTEIDLAGTLKKKLGADVDPYVILGACNPKLAHRAVSAEPAIGLLLPCNVVLTADGPDVMVSAASPRAMFSVIPNANAELRDVADEAESRLRRAIDRV